MRLTKYLHTLVKPELDELLEQLNLNEFETDVFRLASKDKSLTEISLELRVSESTVYRTIQKIKAKVLRLENEKWNNMLQRLR